MILEFEQLQNSHSGRTPVFVFKRFDHLFFLIKVMFTTYLFIFIKKAYESGKDLTTRWTERKEILKPKIILANDQGFSDDNT